jgi:hypothetical protein
MHFKTRPSFIATMLFPWGTASRYAFAHARALAHTGVVFLLLILFPLTSCRRCPQEYKKSELNIHLNIHLNVITNGQPEHLPEPEMVRVMFFDPDTYDLYTEAYLPAGGGRVSLPPGRYKLLAYNFDTESILLRNDRNYLSIEAYTNEVSSALKNSMLNSLQNGLNATKADNGEEAWNQALEDMALKPVVYEPDHLFVSRQDIEIMDDEQMQVIEAEAETIIETWKISVNVENREYISSARAMLTGMIGSSFIGRPKEEGKSDTDVTLIFDMIPGTDENGNDVLTGRFHTFGKNPASDNRMWLSILIRNTGGQTVEWHQDISDTFLLPDAEEEQIIHVEDDIEVPQPESAGSGGGGFQPGVYDWEQEIIPIDI